MASRRAALALLLLVVALHATDAAEPAARNELSITGLTSELEDAVRSGLTLQQYRDREVSDAQLRRLIGIGEDEARSTLEAWGYYDGKLSHRIETQPGGFHVWFDIEPGEPTLVTESRVTVSGDAANAAGVKTALQAFTPRVGQRFDHAQYETSKAAVQTALTDNGFLGTRQCFI